jgi:hypothetical protein
VSSPEQFEFVNRTAELEALLDSILQPRARGLVTFLKSPSGYGKSRLVDRLIERLPADGPTCVLVDPAIRSQSRSDRVYAWFFVQRAAEPGARIPVKGHRPYRSFTEFVRKKKWRRLNWQDLYGHAKNISSLGDLVKLGIEFIENVFKRGRYSPKALLQEDSWLAAEMAEEYVRALLSYRPTLFVVRETQNIDPESLRFFLSVGAMESSCTVIFEYTTPDHKFSPEHQKIIFELVLGPFMSILDLHKLSLPEFHYLLRKYAAKSVNVEALAELQWDGNLRIIRELKYHVMIRHVHDTTASLDLEGTMQRNIADVPKERRLILALVATHVEPIEQQILVAVARRIDPLLSESVVLFELEQLLGSDGYIRMENSAIVLTDENLMTAIVSSRPMQALLKLTSIALRDYYLEIVNGDLFASVPLPSALRQAVALCAATGDIFALRTLISILDRSARRAHDQTLYVGIVAETVLTNVELAPAEREELVEWGAAAAYESGDFPTAVKLLEALPQRRAYHTAMLACCYTEINRHDSALALAESLERTASEGVRLAAHLIKCLSLYALGRKGEAWAIHDKMRRDVSFAKHPLFGFVLRFSEVVEDFPVCCRDVWQSGTFFRRAGLPKSAAYSVLSGATHLAYLGKVKAAQQRVKEAERVLRLHVRDQSIVYNNAVVVELLSRGPNLPWCLERLTAALFTVGDDFSRLTLHTNCLICYALQMDVERADHVVEVMERILAAPGFGNRDIFVTVSFNVWRYCIEAGHAERASYWKSIAMKVGLENTCYSNYWMVRFGLKKSAEPAFDFLLKQKYHPEYLSHWLIDLEGLKLLKGECGQSLDQRSGPAS